MNRIQMISLGIVLILIGVYYGYLFVKGYGQSGSWFVKRKGVFNKYHFVITRILLIASIFICLVFGFALLFVFK